MIKLRRILVAIALSTLLLPTLAWSAVIGGPHLWLSTFPSIYVSDSPDAWLEDSFVTSSNPFALYITNAAPFGSSTATDITLMLAIHSGELGSGSVFVNGTEYSAFPYVVKPPQYGAGSHGVYFPSGDANYDLAPLGFPLIPGQTNSVEISWSGFSMVHFDVFGTGGVNNRGVQKYYYNPPSHDVTAVPEPGTMLLLGSGLIGMAALGWGRKKFRK